MPSSRPMSQWGDPLVRPGRRRGRSPRRGRPRCPARPCRRGRRATGTLGMRSSRSRSSSATPAVCCVELLLAFAELAALGLAAASASSTRPSRRRPPTSLDRWLIRLRGPRRARRPGSRLLLVEGPGPLEVGAQVVAAAGQRRRRPRRSRSAAGARRAWLARYQGLTRRPDRVSTPVEPTAGGRLGARRGPAVASPPVSSSPQPPSPSRSADRPGRRRIEVRRRWSSATASTSRSTGSPSRSSAGHRGRPARTQRRGQDLDGRGARGLPPTGAAARCACSGSTRGPITPR